MNKFAHQRVSQVAAAVAASAVMIALAPAGHAQAARYQIGIEGHVPVICHVSLDAGQVDANAANASLGQLKEFCNNPRGYQVIADYAPALAGASLIVDGVEIPLNGSGSVAVSSSNRAAKAEHKVELKLSGSAQPGTLSFRIQPL